MSSGRLHLYTQCHRCLLNVPADPATISSEGDYTCTLTAITIFTGLSTMATEEDYVCTLTEASLEKAKRELNEDPKNRMGAVETFRTWIKQQPHFRCKTGRTSEQKQDFKNWNRIDNCCGLNEYPVGIDHNCYPVVVKYVEIRSVFNFINDRMSASLFIHG